MTEIKIDKLLRSKRRTIGLEITQEAKLVVRAPHHVSQKDIENIIFKKRTWIIEKQNLIQQRKSEYSAKQFVNGESFYYLGKTYRLKLIDKGIIKLTDYLEFPRPLLLNAKENLIQWYKACAYEKIEERINWYSKIIGLPYLTMKISYAKKRLGSCSTKGNLNFSWRLIMAPLYIVDYVVVHELAHIEEHNHSQKFWAKVQLLLPKYQQAKSWMSSNQYLLEL